MKLFTLKRILKYAFLIAIIVVSSSDVDAQRRKRRGRKNKTPKVMQNIPDFFINDGFVPNRLKRVYRRDATRMALRLLNKEQRISQQSVEVPDELVQSLYNSLLAIRVSDYGAIDTIATEYNVRTYPIPNVNYMTLVFEHDAKWAQPLRNRADTTGSPSLNRLIRKYNLVLTKMVYLDEERAGLVLQSREPLNMSALARRVFFEEGIGSIEEMLPYGDGNDITAKRVKEGWEIVYSVRFGNCLRRCKKKYTWKFLVSEGGQVTYKGGKGDTIPPWISIKNTRTIVEVPDVINKAKSTQPYYKGKENENN